MRNVFWEHPMIINLEIQPEDISIINSRAEDKFCLSIPHEYLFNGKMVKGIAIVSPSLDESECEKVRKEYQQKWAEFHWCEN